MSSLPAVPVDVLTELKATFHPSGDAPSGVRHGDIRLPNGYGLSVAHSPRHYCGPGTVEVAVIHDPDGNGTWPLDHDSIVPAEMGSNDGAVLGWADMVAVITLLRRLAVLPDARTGALPATTRNEITA